MDPEIADLLQKAKDAGRTPFWQGTVAQARSGPMLMELLFGPAPHVERVEDFCVPSSGGYALPVRLYVPGSHPKGLIVYFHGGGWVLGSVAGFHPLTATLAQKTGCAVLSVDYRLAPEHVFPLPLQDAQAALSWGATHAASRIGSSFGNLIAMGDSAGGNLATVAARLHNEACPDLPVSLQVLAYPVTDCDFETSSFHQFSDGYLLTRRDMMWFWDQYLPEADKRTDPLASPLRCLELRASPQTLILSAGLDPLRDEGEIYGQRLLDAGVPTSVLRFEGLPHGFLSMIYYAPTAGRAFESLLLTIEEHVVR